MQNLPYTTSWQDLKDYFRAAGNGAWLSHSSLERGTSRLLTAAVAHVIAMVLAIPAGRSASAVWVLDLLVRSCCSRTECTEQPRKAVSQHFM